MESEFSTKEHNPRSEESFGAQVLASTLAHEMRNPLQAMKLKIDAGKRGVQDENLFKELSESLNRLEGVIQKVQRLNTDYHIHYARVDFNDLLEHVLSSFTFWLETAGIEVQKHIKWEGAPLILGDFELLGQVFLNLITNAADSMEELGGVLTIRITECEHNAHIEFSDTGKGMDSETLSSVGTPFFTTKEKGNGLGLAFCKTIVNLHQGSLTIQSQENSGTKISIRIPKAPSQGN